MNMFRFLIPLFLTVFLEEAGALACSLRGRHLIEVLLVNMITNPAMHLAAGISARVLPMETVMRMVWFVFEPLIILAEGNLYARDRSFPHPYRMSLIMNLITITGGLVWNYLIG